MTELQVRKSLNLEAEAREMSGWLDNHEKQSWSYSKESWEHRTSNHRHIQIYIIIFSRCVYMYVHLYSSTTTDFVAHAVIETTGSIRISRWSECSHTFSGHTVGCAVFVCVYVSFHPYAETFCMKPLLCSAL